VQFPKTHPVRDKMFLEFIRSQPCLICFAQSVPHHLEIFGASEKGDDWLTVPLCPQHHTLGPDSIHTLGELRFNDRHMINVWEHTAKLQVKYHKDAA